MLAAAWVWFSALALGQVAAPDVSVAAALRSLASRSGVVFEGRVTAIRPVGGVVEIVFGVEQPILGDVGGIYTLREWGGLWAAGQRRYTVGERVAIFLHSPGAAGLSSPVDGMEGILPVVQVSADSEPLLDVRRLAARVLRPVGSPLVDAGNGAMTLAEVKDVVADWKRPTRPDPVRRPLPFGIEPAPMTPVRVVKEPVRVILPVGMGR
jgi:hypothetical protein